MINFSVYNQDIVLYQLGSGRWRTTPIMHNSILVWLESQTEVDYFVQGA